MKNEAQLLLYARDVARLNSLRRTYEQLVPTALDPAAALPAPRVCEASILFADIRGFTGLAERWRSDPAHLLEILNERLEVMVRAVLRCGGTVEKFLGDGLFATFGAWTEADDHPARALAAGIALVGANQALNRRSTEVGGVVLELGVGLCTGWILIGPIGPRDRWELGVLGDPVNVAARLVAQARPSEVLLCSSTYEAVQGKVAADLLGDQVVRGRVGSLSIYRLALGRGEPVRRASHQRSAVSGQQSAVSSPEASRQQSALRRASRQPSGGASRQRSAVSDQRSAGRPIADS